MFEKLFEKIKDKNLIIFGEIHGTREIPALILNFIYECSKREIFNLGLELPGEIQEKINLFLKEGNIKILEGTEFFRQKGSDGRNSKEILNLIEGIFKLNKKIKNKISIICLEGDYSSQEEKEERLSKKVLENIKSKKLIVLIGEIHASKEPIYFEGKEIITAGSKLKNTLREKAFFVRISPGKGSFYNFGVREIKDTNKEFNKNFDEVIVLEKVNPCSFIL